MRVTTKGQVTIPQHIRDKFGITPAVEIDFIGEKDRVYLVEQKGGECHTPNISEIEGNSNCQDDN